MVFSCKACSNMLYFQLLQSIIVSVVLICYIKEQLNRRMCFLEQSEDAIIAIFFFFYNYRRSLKQTSPFVLHLISSLSSRRNNWEIKKISFVTCLSYGIAYTLWVTMQEKDRKVCCIRTDVTIPLQGCVERVIQAGWA